MKELKDLYKWVIVPETLTHAKNIISFELSRQYNPNVVDIQSIKKVDVTLVMVS